MQSVFSAMIHIPFKLGTRCGNHVLSFQVMHFCWFTCLRLVSLFTDFVSTGKMDPSFMAQSPGLKVARITNSPTPAVQIPKSKAGEATKVAIDAGFRHIDAAYFYQNEEEIGAALREKIADGTVQREDIFYISKLWATFLRPELVRPGLERSLKKLQLSYVDLFLIHMPLALKPGEELLPKDANGDIILDTVDIRDIWE
ncbi:PREDICTED: prostaglandin-E(2) 9-reductase-like, partial [Galeopterus variegatus]|uniref:Prostaglandin-E(2) 9-reductase-like n=1 Tax=Galeopterus variegatus TaxID=482537 RepID=A0ABM0SIG2_GALVR